MILSISEKRCGRCKKVLPISKFQKNRSTSSGYQCSCNTCRSLERKLYKDHINQYHRNYSKKVGITGHVSRKSSNYLGVVIAENVLERYFNNVIRMPYGNPGYDFLCNRGFKIDVKSSCLLRHGRAKVGSWGFHINRNTVADYFICLAFDNRSSLIPMHIWIIPGHAVNQKTELCITLSDNVLKKWAIYERPIERVLKCCNETKVLI